MANLINFSTYGFLDDILALDENNWRNFFKPVIYDSIQGGLEVTTGSGMTVNVSSGECRCGAVMGISNSQMSLDVNVGDSTYSRIDSVVIQYIYGDPSTLSVTVLEGEPNASPVPPTLTKSYNSLWQMEIAEILIPANTTTASECTITDKRIIYNSLDSMIDPIKEDIDDINNDIDNINNDIDNINNDIDNINNDIDNINNDIQNINTNLNLKAPLLNPALDGTPTAPTAASGTNTTQIATTAFVQDALVTGFRDVYKVTLPSASSSKLTFTATGITENHVMVIEGYAYFSNPSAVASKLTLTTSANKITIAGTLSGTTDIIVTLGIPRTITAS